MGFDIKDLTLEEKLHMLTGKNGWATYDANGKVPSVSMADGPSGLRKEDDTGAIIKATAMPTLSHVASTWSRECARLDGETIADDCIENGVDILLAPGVNIKRTPLNGRNFEYFSEDPYLSGELASAYICGVQSKGIGTSLKHFCANNREFDRNTQSSEVDERTLREIYTRAFEIAVRQQPWTVMCSYNPVNGVYASENKKLLNDLLREEMGFNGVIVSDWGAVHSDYKAVNASLDLRMPYSSHAFGRLKAAYEHGLLRPEAVDACADRMLALAQKKTEAEAIRKVTTTCRTRHENAVRIASEGIVLLKNDGVLPLKKEKCLVLGPVTEDPLIGGRGSSHVRTNYTVKGLTQQLNESGANCTYLNYLSESGSVRNIKQCYMNAQKSDVVILGVAGQTEKEGIDRTDIRINQTEENLIHELHKFNRNIIVLVYAGSAIDMHDWIDEVSAVVFVGLGGEGIHEALASILTGEISPSGKLTETFPLCLEDTCTGRQTGDGTTEWYREGIFVGYRYFEKYEKPVLFPFGHGLSYARFRYSDLKIIKQSETEYDVQYTIENLSDITAKEVSQVYVSDPVCMVVRPEKELKGFSKDEIPAHGSKRITVHLSADAFAYYSVAYDRWHVENGDFLISVGSASDQIHLSDWIEITLPDDTQQTPHPGARQSVQEY